LRKAKRRPLRVRRLGKGAFVDIGKSSEAVEPLTTRPSATGVNLSKKSKSTPPRTVTQSRLPSSLKREARISKLDAVKVLFIVETW
jgi:hypothetical protein